MPGKLIFIAGLAQLGIVIGSLAIPYVLEWREDTAKLQLLTRQVFWTCAGYIWATNLSFAIVSICSPESLVDSSFLTTAVTVFIATYWGARVIIQFVWFDKTDAPKGPLFLVAEIVLVSSFVFLTAFYGYAACHNLMGQ